MKIFHMNRNGKGMRNLVLALAFVCTVAPVAQTLGADSYRVRRHPVRRTQARNQAAEVVKNVVAMAFVIWMLKEFASSKNSWSSPAYNNRDRINNEWRTRNSRYGRSRR